ncbi:MAG TPA: ABC transporter ATP-binding protein [Steroidobacteraceae bacterium]|nr:ABC transporter ATP-binding protein [Steroidobacteraceae bacterium]
MSEAVVLAAQGLGKRIGGRAVLKDVSFAVPRGCVVGLVGKNGAGKSTLFDLLLGFARPTVGSCSVFGESSSALTAAARARIGFVPQQDELPGLLTGAQQLALVAALHERWNAQLVARLAHEWEVPLERRIGRLSGGERQKLATLCALGHEPELLVLDEPASSLDPVARRQFMREILAIAGEGTRTLVYASHLIGDLERVASHIWLLREGSLLWQGELDALKESVVRVHLRATAEFDPGLSLPGQLTRSVTGRTAVFTVDGWNDMALQGLRERVAAEIEIEPMGLEDIFLAMHA